MENIAKKISKKNKIAHRKLTPGTLLNPEEEILCIPEGQFPTKNNSYSTIYATPASPPLIKLLNTYTHKYSHQKYLKGISYNIDATKRYICALSWHGFWVVVLIVCSNV